jgi:hypothetical protein
MVTIDVNFIKNFVSYLKTTKDHQWCTHMMTNSLGQRCLLGHLADYMNVKDDSFEFNLLLENFEFIVASKDVIYNVNDGHDKNYSDISIRDRCIKFIQDKINKINVG